MSLAPRCRNATAQSCVSCSYALDSNYLICHRLSNAALDGTAGLIRLIARLLDSGKGIGERTIINIMRNRRRLAGNAEADTDDKRGLVAIREAIASLIAHGQRKGALHVREDRFEFPTDLAQP